MKRILFFGNSPDLSASMRFFVNVPVFLAMSGLLLAWAGPAALQSRWAPATLALTHLITLGVMASAMIGALLQILPVTTSIYVAATRLTASIVHTTLTTGTLALAAGFLWQSIIAARLGFVLLAICFTWLLGAIILGFWTHRRTRTAGSQALLASVILAICALLVTVSLGLLLLTVRAWGSRVTLPGATDIHGLWGLAGWMGLLLAGVSFKVIPVFQATELFPHSLMKQLPRVVFGLLIAWSALVATNTPWSQMLATPAGFLLGLAWLSYAVVALQRLRTRKRPQADTNSRFWYLTMLCFACCMPAWLWLQASHDPRAALLLGVLATMGVAVSAINGMLYKIMPVLLWNHAQMPLKRAMPEVPKMKDILPDAMGRPAFRVHALALLGVLLACLWPGVLARTSGILVLISALWLARNMSHALRVYRRARRDIARALHGVPGDGRPPTSQA